jgi:polyisoprenoid-binding protein YceI
MKPLLAAAALLAASTASAGAYVVDPSASVVKFHLHHKMHEVDGRSSQIEGKAVLQDDGRVMTMIRIPVASFDTADANRDSHMRETLDAAKFPYVIFKGVTSLTVPVATGKGIPAKLEGELEFHGVKQPISVPAEIVLAADGTATVSSKFPVNLEAHKIERPSLLFIKVDENVEMDVALKLKATK